MGILDDAIREHLELKRQHGARDSEIQELEDQAFGPPSRPGDPDFPEHPAAGDEHAGGNGGPAAEAAVAGPPADVESPPPAPESPAVEIGSVGQNTEPFDAATAAGAPAGEAAPVEEAPAPEESGGGQLFDQALDEEVGGDELDLGVEDLDLELDEESAEPAAEVAAGPDPEAEPEEPEATAAPEPLVEPAQAAPPPPPTEEQLLPSEDLLDEEEDELGLSLEPEDENEDELGDGAEDVLEETPDFLRDAPDDEELWFEQGAPQDFDFEDEED